MKMVTLTFGLVILLLGAGIPSLMQADEVVTRNRFFVPDEQRHQWIDERNGRVGILEIHGELLSSPCILQTNEVVLPLMPDGIGMRYPLQLNLTGCGEGADMTSSMGSISAAPVVMNWSASFFSRSGAKLSPEYQLLGSGKMVLRGGNRQLTWYLNSSEHQQLVGISKDSHNGQNRPGTQRGAFLSLLLAYE